jgi:hypothetical protein
MRPVSKDSGMCVVATAFPPRPVQRGVPEQFRFSLRAQNSRNLMYGSEAISVVERASPLKVVRPSAQ